MNADVNTVAIEECPIDAPTPVTATLLAEFDFLDWNSAQEDARVPTTTGAATIVSEQLNSAFPWMREGLQKIAVLGALHDDWHELGISPPNEVATGLATLVLRKLAEVDFKPNSIDASTDEGICISFRDTDRRANIECFNNGEILAAKIKKGGEPCIWELNEPHLSDGIASIYNFIYG